MIFNHIWILTMNYITGTPRNQLELFNEKLDEVVSADNPVRFIDTYVSNINMSKLGFSMPKCRNGRPL